MGDMVMPDAILPSQMPRGGHRMTLQPEKRLMYAVLEDAINVYRGRDAAAAAEAAAWFHGADVAPCVSPFAFENVCATLDLDPEWLRSGIFRNGVGKVCAASGGSSQPGRQRD